jgi:pyruvate dehydrogenase (quinone)
MAQTVSDYLVARLHRWGVTRIYGYPGDGINGVIAAIRRSDHLIDFVQVRHEENAALAACAEAKYGGALGVCLATSGPGAIHLLNGLYDAKLDHKPVLALVGQQPRKVLGSSYMQEVDLVSLYKDVAGYVQEVVHPGQIQHVVDRAARIALAERTVTALVLPSDAQLEEIPVRLPEHHGLFPVTGVGMSKSETVPSQHDLIAAAAILNHGERVAILVGQGALGASEEVTEVADILGAGVAKALLGKPVLSDDLPWVTGAIGMLGTKPSWNLMQQCDTLLVVGSSLPYVDFLPPVGQARAVQIDDDGRMLGLRYPMESNLLGDSRATLRALIPWLERKPDPAWRRRVEHWVEDWWKIVEARAMNPADPINGQRVFWELSSRLPSRAMLAVDCGTATGWYARDVRLRAGMSGWLSGTLATMGTGLPYAIAAKFAHPDRPCIALLGDGAMQMNGMAELITVAKYWRQWADPSLVILVLNNRDLAFVSWEQRAMVGDIRFDASQDIPDVPYAKYAEMLGLRGIRVDRPDDVGPAWDEALASDRPVVYEAIVDPDVPPLPPHITVKQAMALTRALLKGDPDAGGVIRQTLRDLIEDYVPH